MSDFLANFLTLAYAILRFHPELVEIVQPLQAILPFDHDNFTTFSAGLAYYAYVSPITEAYDAEIGGIIEQFFAHKDVAFTRMSYSLYGLLSLLAAGKVQDIETNSVPLMEFANTKIGFYQDKPFPDDGIILASILRCAEAIDDATHFASLAKVLVKKFHFGSFWTIEIAESLLRLISQQKPPFETEEMLQAFVPFLQKCLDGTTFLTCYEEIIQLLQHFSHES